MSKYTKNKRSQQQMIDMFGLPYTIELGEDQKKVYNDEYTDEVEFSLEDLQQAYNLTKEEAQTIWDIYTVFRKETKNE
tara:strand:+ start:2259 stop:2492 length:234 start_codon:yes stop_codon:yes gene_type:complete